MSILSVKEGCTCYHDENWIFLEEGEKHMVGMVMRRKTVEINYMY